jgi:hypothetical protein
MSLKYRIGQRIGYLQLYQYVGKDESGSNNHIYIARCSCGKSEQVSSHELPTGQKIACRTCAPPVRAESPREWLQSERQRIADDEQRKRQEESARIAEQQRQDAIQRELTRQKRLQDFMNDEGEFSPEAQAGWKRVRGYHEVYKRGE